EFGPANSAWQTLDMLAFVVGPALGGILLALNDLALAFLLNGVSFFLIAAVLWTLPKAKARTASSLPAVEAAAATAETVETPVARGATADTAGPAAGTPAAANTLPMGPSAPVHASFRRLPRRPLAGIFTIDAANAFVSQALFTLLVILVAEVYRSGDASVGFLNAAIGVGGVVGAVVTGVLVLRRNLAPAVLTGALTAGAATILLGLTHVVEVAFVLVGVTAAASVALDVSDTTIFQRVVPDELRGRATGAWMSATTLFNAAGSLVAPLLFTTVGLLPLMLGMGAALVAGGLAAVTPIGAAAIREPTTFERQLLRAARLPVFAGLAPARVDHALRHVHAMTFNAG
ncbi:MAG: MFS transporter, partial [Chloroflexota bacterium]|nr:MFS transporter [Chloroflexota bacterium]